MKLLKNIFVLSLFTLFGAQYGVSQESYDDCANAFHICPGDTATLNNISATVDNCGTCEDGNVVCFLPINTIWIQFTTNATGGDVDVEIMNLQFVNEPGRAVELQGVVYEAGVPCDASTYNDVSNCENFQITDFTLTATGLQPNTTYYVMINGNSSGPGISLPAEATFEITVNGPGFDAPIPDVQLSVPNTTICRGQNINAEAILTNCNGSGVVHWYLNGSLVQSSTSDVFVSSAINDGDQISFAAECSFQCPDTLFSDTISITVIDVIADAGEDVTITPGQNTQLDATVQGSNFSWTPSSNLSNPNSTNPVADPSQSTEYFLTVTEGGCTVIDSVWVFVEDKVTIPKAFTPNNDNINDVWEVLNVQDFPNNYIVIYDRWGQKVYESTSYGFEKFWNGSNRRENRLVPAGTYFYVLELRDEDDTVYKGSVSVIY